jgi:hypothetical protein
VVIDPVVLEFPPEPDWSPPAPLPVSVVEFEEDPLSSPALHATTTAATRESSIQRMKHLIVLRS